MIPQSGMPVTTVIAFTHKILKRAATSPVGITGTLCILEPGLAKQAWISITGRNNIDSCAFV